MSPTSPRPKDPRKPILLLGIVLLAASAASYAVDTVRVLSPWLLLAGAVLVLFYFVLRRVAATPATKRSESTMFRDSTQLGEPDDRRR